MKMRLLLALLLVPNFIFALCLEDACGPHPGMPNYLCADGITIAGPGDCVELASGECVWEIMTCPEISMQGYLRRSDVNFCMDACAEFYVESEIDAEFGYMNVISLNDALDIDLYIDRFVNVEIGEQIDCIECSAGEIISIKISDECQYPVDCWADPCEYAGECQVNIPTECIANYCGGCFADYYDLDGYVIDCYNNDCDPDLNCGYAETCCGGLLYPTTCCSNNCDAPIGECDDGFVECSDIDNPSECNSADCEWIGDNSDPWGNGQCVDVGFDDCHAFTGCNECANVGCFWQTSQPWTGVGLCAEDCLIADMDCYGNAEDWVAECPEVTDCVDLSGLDFGDCEMMLGVGLINGECQYVSGCDWLVDYTDYSDAFFDTMNTCESVCNVNIMTCDEISNMYEGLHSEEEYTSCVLDNDCMAVWGHCDVGLGGCHYSVNEESYMEEDINNLLDMWMENNCMQGVCDCASPPYAQCVDGSCSSVYCMNDNPAGCLQTGCEEGYECIIIPNDCVPSFCDCSGFYGEWYCTEDCGGGTCVASSHIGDMNSDGTINVVDIVIAVQFILEGEYNPLGDMDNDGSINVVDIVLIVNIVLGAN